MTEFSIRGGARFGWVNASWPFASLTLSADRLVISSLERFEFAPAQVVSIEPYGSIPLLASGIRINHNRADYPAKVIFWCMGNRNKVLARIREIGFLPSGTEGVRASGFPIRWRVVLAFIVIWNALFLLDGGINMSRPREPGPLALLALLLLFAFSTAVRRSETLQNIVLSKDHHVGEIKAFLVLIQLISGLMSVVFGAMLLVHTYAG